MTNQLAKKRTSLRNLIVILASVMLFQACELKAPELTENDWPQFKKDNYRSANSPLELDLKTQGEAWVYQASQKPVPAWYGPAKEDAYAVSGPLPSMRDYDLSYYPIIVGSKLYYGSSSDDAVHCINADTGKEKWHFTTDGPIRIAPTYDNGNLYFGSDDGYVYCVDARKGKLIWKYSPSPANHQKVLNNGRLISFWPIRTGVLIEGGIAYFGASMLPWKKSFVCAVNVETGQPDIAGTYVKEHNDMNMTLEGAMASTGSMLIQPQGRISPAFLNKTTGEKKGQLAGTGGCFVLVTPDQNVVHGHSSRFKSIVESPIEKNPEFMTFKEGKEMVVKGDTSYVLNESSIAAYHRETKKMLWLRRNYQAHRIIIAGDVLFAGGTDKVYGISTKNGLPVWEADVEGTVYALSVANKGLYASTNTGRIYCFKKGFGENSLFDTNSEKEAGIDESIKKEETAPDYEILQLKAGPFVHALSTDSILLQFETFEPSKINVEWKTEGSKLTITSDVSIRKYQLSLPVRQGFTYSYELVSETGEKAEFEYDNFFNFAPEVLSAGDLPRATKSHQQQIATFLKSYPRGKGFGLVLGEESAQSAIELAAQSELNVVNIEDSSDEIEAFRKKLQKEGVYGRKISALKVERLANLPIISEVADLVWVNKGSVISPDEVIRLIAPNQYAVVNGVKDIDEWLDESMLSWQVEVKKYKEDAFLLIKNPIEDTGSWTHQYGKADNSSFGGESLWGASSTNDFEVQWMGRPGPRFQTDRSGRKPSPLAVNGKLFVQGNERIIAVNVYNGTVYWAKDFPGLKRMNVLRDCSNWAADNEYLYLAIDDQLHQVNQQNGEVLAVLPISKYHDGTSNWSYIGLVEDQLIGSASKEDANFSRYHGGRGWYDAKDGMMSFKVLSNRLFSLSKNGFQKNWEYQPQGAVINPTILISNGKISFVETRSPNEESMLSGRGGDEIYKNAWLVSLDVTNGEKIWERRVKTIAGKTSYFMVAGNQKYVIASSQDGKYDVQVYDEKDGSLRWKKIQKWFHGDHGAHMSKPAIVGTRLMIKPVLYNLESGEEINYNVPKVGHGCAHYALTEQSVFYRGGSVTQFNFDNRNFSKWERLRPDCWLSTIPAEGMILSPEAGGGCSCGNWLETSMVMAPISRAPITIKSLGETSTRDYKDESWGDYIHTCAFNEFVNSVEIELLVKPGVEGNLYYTTDGSEPNKNSTKYTEPFSIDHSLEVRAAIFLVKGGKERKFVRGQQFVKVKPSDLVADNK
ncbi:outer membrane protein assembly factor BamB family protein [Sunxiuqinia sp. sy24]|uniref:outer membrane protein assembly factor BamB family protein n=1 Tax=Sunxiuqinia sp. sy24 TaxID=3461495 RepID=UPI004045323B